MEKSITRCLQTFLSLTNENTQTSKLVKKLLKEVGRDIRWLDIGAGNGEKVVCSLDKDSCVEEVIFVEPDLNWASDLESSGTKLASKGVLTKTHHKKMDSSLALETFRYANFITAFHLLYDPILTKDLLEILAQNLTEAQGVLVTAEHESSDLAILRRKIETETGLIIARSGIKDLVYQLEKLDKWTVSSFELDKQTLNLAPTDLDHEWFYDFLAGYDGAYLQLQRQLKDEVRNIVIQFVQDKDFELSTPDHVVTINLPSK